MGPHYLGPDSGDCRKPSRHDRVARDHYYTAKTQRRETIRKERAMLLTSKLGQNVNQLMAVTTAKPGAELSPQDRKDL